jgi:hypothetical protein
VTPTPPRLDAYECGARLRKAASTSSWYAARFRATRQMLWQLSVASEGEVKQLRALMVEVGLASREEAANDGADCDEQAALWRGYYGAPRYAAD